MLKLRSLRYLRLWQTRILPLKDVAFVVCMDSDMLVAARRTHLGLKEPR